MNQISIIIPLLNGVNTIRRAIDSALAQRMVAVEVIVIDNGSTDGSLEVVNEMRMIDTRIRLLHSARGRSKARNVGIKAARGQYIQFIDADDEVDSVKFSQAINIFQAMPEVVAVTNNVDYHNDIDGNQTRFIVPSNAQKTLLFSNPYPINAVIMRNSNVKPFLESLEHNEDWLFWVNNLYKKSVVHLDETLGVVHISGMNTMSDYDVMRYNEIIVRGEIKRLYPDKSLTLFKRDVRFMIDYLLLSSNNTNNLQGFALEFLLAKTLLKFPIIRNKFQRKLEYSRRSSLYQQ